MGVPFVDAPCEAESQCAEMARYLNKILRVNVVERLTLLSNGVVPLHRTGKVYGTATEDMDALTFRTPKLIRKLTFAAALKQPILEIDYPKMLAGLGLTYDEFVDLCILCGCDYCSSIKGIGPKTALKLIKQVKLLFLLFFMSALYHVA